MDRFGYNLTGNVSEGKRKPVLVYVDSRTLENKTDYTVELGTTYRDVISIELVKAVVPNPSDDDYLVLQVTNVNVNNVSNSPLLGNALCTLERTSAVASPLVYKRNNSEHNIAYMTYLDQPIKLSKLKIKFRRPDDSTPDFGIDNHLLVFEINTLNQPVVPF